MHTVRRWLGRLMTDPVFRNSVILITTRIGTKIATSCLLIYVARLLGDALFGIYSTILTLIAFFGVFEEFGLTVPLIRRIAQREKAAGILLGEVLAIKCWLGIVAFVGLILSTYITVPIPIVFGISMVFEMMNISVMRGFEGREQMKNISYILLIEKAVLGVVSITLLIFGFGLTGVGVAYLLSNIVSMSVGIWYWRKEGERIVLSVRRGRALSLLKEAFPFASIALISAFYMRIDTVFLVMYRPIAEVGWYNAAFRLSDAQLFIPTAIIASVFPILSRTFFDNRGEFLRHYQRTFYIMFAIGTSFAVVGSIVAGPIIRILYGEQYAMAADSFRLLSCVMPFYYVNNLIGNSLIAMGKEKIVTITFILGAAFNLGMNALFVKEYGQVGASAIKILTEMLAFGIQFYSIHQVIPIRGTYWQKA